MQNSMDLSYVKKIQKWVDLDNKILKNKTDIKHVVDEKNSVESEIMEYVETNNLHNLNISITDGSIKFQKKNTTQILSMRLLKNLLIEYFTGKNDQANLDSIEEITNYISSKLDTKTSYTMKRVVATIDS